MKILIVNIITFCKYYKQKHGIILDIILWYYFRIDNNFNLFKMFS